MKRSESIFKGLKRLFKSDRRNWKVVALCIAGATTFWFFNALNKDYATRINYPVEFVFDKEGVVVVEDLPEEVGIVISGGGWNLLRKTAWFNLNPIQILLENPTSQKYITKSSLATIIADQLNEVRLNYVITDTLFLDIERKETKKVALAIDSSGITLEKGFRIVSPLEIEPDSAIFVGPSSFISQLSDSILLDLPYEQLNETFDNVVDLSFMESEQIQVEPDEIAVAFEVAHFTRVDKRVPIRPLNFPADSSVYLADTAILVSFMVRDELLKQGQETNIVVSADFRQINRQDSTVQLKIGEVPAFIKDIVVEKQAVPLEYADERQE
ncbi:YbbR-like domain-containing protein [Nafulsella turpanensis]|uniref:hypothetical protein n=1 Tax=Nafulsella turpanensis TaxID=1265690 RepID=UPI000348C478|nr:hypothetical protein [Nafulsella turpanensis]